MRVVYFGTPEFAVPPLAALLVAGHDVVAVVTQPDRPRTRSHSTLLPSPVKKRALQVGLTVLQPDATQDVSVINLAGAVPSRTDHSTIQRSVSTISSVQM